MAKWINANDALPVIAHEDYGMNESNPVLVLLHSGAMFTAYIRQYVDDPPQWVLCGRDGYTTDEVTHWQELPSLPQQ